MEEFLMRTWLAGERPLRSRFSKFGISALLTRICTAGAVLTLLSTPAAFAEADTAAGEASLKLPDLSQVSFLGIDGHTLLSIGILFCIMGLVFGMVIYNRLKNLPVHR